MTNVAFITGASSGLGAGFARRLAAEGYGVGLAARRLDRLEDLAGEIRVGGGRACAVECDVSDREQVAAAVATVEAELGPVDLLIANAGRSAMTVPTRLDATLVETILRVNFLGAVYAVERVLPSMLERGSGHLVAIGSQAGYGGLPLTGAYSASKGALHNFMESLRIDLRGTGVAVTMITPGYVHTELTQKNIHPMPFAMEIDDALDLMMRAIRRRSALCTFPRPLSTVTWIAQVLPPRIYDWLASKVRREKRE